MTRQDTPPLNPGLARRTVPIYCLTLIGALAWLGAIFLAPYLESRSSLSAASFVYGLFAPLCHQIPARCFYFHGFPLAVCGRCLGVYSGFLAGLVIYPFARGFSRLALPPVRRLMFLSLPIGVDYLANLFRIWSSAIGIRFATGFVWGAILPFYFLTGAAELWVWAKSQGLAKSGRKKVEFRPQASEEQS